MKIFTELMLKIFFQFLSMGLKIFLVQKMKILNPVFVV